MYKVVMAPGTAIRPGDFRGGERKLAVYPISYQRLGRRPRAGGIMMNFPAWGRSNGPLCRPKRTAPRRLISIMAQPGLAE